MSDSATTITPELIAELRERYTPPTIPPCRVCGGELSIAQVGGGQPTVWACSGKEDDPERPGWLRDAPGRWTNAPDGGSSEFRADGHYNRSQWTDYRSGGDSGVIAVLDALESKVQQPAAVDGIERLTEQQAVVVTGYTGVLCCGFDAFHADLERRAGRPVFTHEMADSDWIKPLYRDDFLTLAAQQEGES